MSARIILRAASIAVAAILASGSGAQACGAVVLAQPAAPSERLAAEILKILLEDAFDCDVTAAIADAEPALRAAGRAALFVGPVEETATTAPVVIAGAPADAAERADEVALGAALYGGLEEAGFFTPRWFAETRPELRSLDDLAGAAELFARDGRTPRLFVCPRAWACFDETMAVVDALGLDGPFEIVAPASGEALAASLRDAQAARAPWVGYYWTPSEAAAEAPIARIPVGSVRIDDGAGGDRPPFADPPLSIAYNVALEILAPEAVAALGAFALPLETHLETIGWRALGGAGVDEAALWFYARNPAVWRAWLGSEAEARFETRLRARIEAASGASSPARGGGASGSPD